MFDEAELRCIEENILFICDFSASVHFCTRPVERREMAVLVTLQGSRVLHVTSEGHKGH